MRHAVRGERNRHAVGPLERARELYRQVAEVAIFTPPLDHVEVTSKTFTQCPLDLIFEVKGLQLRCDQGGHHQALRLPRCIAVACNQFPQGRGAFLHIRILCRQIPLREQHIRLKAQIGKLVRRLDQLATGRQKRLAVALGILQAEQALLALEDDFQNVPSVRRFRGSFEQIFPIADNVLVGTTFPGRRGFPARLGQVLL